MKKHLFFLVLAVLLSLVTNAQLTGIKTIPGDYATVATAIADLNTQGVGSGGVTFTIAPGYTETFTSPIAGRITTLTGSTGSPIVFRKSGTGTNPLITAAAGAGVMDAIITLAGCDYVTFSGIDLQENAANITSVTQMEWGYAILKASTTDGSQNITIQNCAITLNKAYMASVGIYSGNHLMSSATQLILASAAGANSNLKIYSNTISNCYSGISISGYNHTTAPYAFYDQNNEIGKDGGNTITNFGGSTLAMNGIYTIYQNNLKVANNSITGAVLGNGQCSGIQLGSSASANLDLYGNTISLQYSGTTGTFYGIYDNMGTTATNTNTINIYNNTVSGCTMAAATNGSCTYINISQGAPNYSLHNNIINNNIYGSSAATATGSVMYMYLFGNPTTKGTVDVYSNEESNNTRIQSVLAAGTTYFYSLGATGNIQNTYNNTAINNTTATSGGVYVFYVSNGSITKNFFHNTLDGINNANGIVMGFYNGSGSALNVYNNTIKNLTSNSAASVVSGMVFNSLGVLGDMIIYNNYVSELYAPNATNVAPAVIGLDLRGQSVNTMAVYNNTIYLDAASSGANFTTCGLNATASPVFNDFRNNIVINNSNPIGSGITSAVRFTTSNIANYSLNSNNNNYYAGIPGIARVIFTDGTNNDQTLANFKLRVNPSEIQSVTENTPFFNSSLTPYNLHVNFAVPSQVESGGVIIATPISITTDNEGDARFPNSGYPLNPAYPAVAPDMGADEFGGIPNDITGPSISYSPLGYTASIFARTLTATITDPHGVPTGGAGLPRLAWKKLINGTWSFVTGTSIGSDKYNFTFGAGVAQGDTVYYFVLAQDNFSTPAAGVYPFNGASGFSANPPACSVNPTNPSSYYIAAQLCGTYTVGVGKNYPTLTAAINDINTKEITCPVVLQLTDATYTSETYPITIKHNPGSSATNTLTIKPAPGINPVISGISALCAIKLNGAQYVIIDGANSAANNQNLTIQNNSPSGLSSVILFSNDGTSGASKIILKNSVFQSSLSGTAATYGILMNVLAGTGGYDGITINNNTINTCRFGISIAGTAGNPVTNVQLTNNTFGSSVQTSGIERHGVEIQNAENILIQGNEIMGLVNGTTANMAIGGIVMVSGNNIRIIGNKVHDWKPVAYALGSSAFGIIYTEDIPMIGEISNNLIYNITYPGSAGSPVTGGNATGIVLGNNLGSLKMYNNTVHLSGNFLSATGSSSSTCLTIGNNNTLLDVRNNLLKNSSQPISGSPSAATYAIAIGTGNTFISLDYNDYFVDGISPSIGYFGGASLVTLADWQTATGKDMNTVNMDPVFTSSANFLPTSALFNNKGVYVTENPFDIIGWSRNNPSDIGAYEFGSDPFVHTLTHSVVTSNSAAVSGDVNAAGNNITTFFDYGTTITYGSFVSATPGSATGTSIVPIQASLSGLNFATTYHFRVRTFTTGGLASYGADSVFTTLPVAPSVITNAATSVTSSTASLNGSVNANGATASVSIQWGLTLSYGNTINAIPASLSGLIAANVMASLSGLTPYTTYHYRVVATNAIGSTNGNDITFTTQAVPATVVTIAASNLIGINATLNGSVNANYAPTNVSFEWGLNTSYGNTINATPSLTTGSTSTLVSAALTGLSLGTTYHFRCVGTGPGGTVYGQDLFFISDCPSPVVPGVIAGLQTVCQNTAGVSYSVASLPLTTGYVWTLPAGASITTGANTNSITVAFSASALSGNITVAGYNTCGTGLTSSLPITVNLLPIPTVSGLTSVCQGSSVEYTTQAGMTNYVWNISGGTIVSGGGTHSVTVTFNALGAQSISVNYSNSNGCVAAAPVIYPITVLALPLPTISGAAVACETTAYLDYSTQPGMTNYVWDMSPNSGTITQSVTNVTTIFWTSPGAKWVSVSYTGPNGCSAATPTMYNVTVNPLPGTPGMISGLSTVCMGAEGVDYSVSAVSNATTYVWTLPAGASIATGAGTNSITVNYSANAISGNVTVLAQNSCGDGMSSALALTVNSLPATAGAIIGDPTICQGSNGVTYSVDAISGATGYNWTVPTGASIGSGANTNSITVDFNLTSVSGDVTVKGSNSCGIGTPANMAVTVNTKPASPVIIQNVNILTSNAATGNQWYKDGVLISGEVAQTYTIPADGTYTDVVTLNGCSSGVSNSIVVIHTGIANPDAQLINVYPNPTSGAFWLSINSPGTTVYEMEILNSFGAIVYKTDKLEVNVTFKQYFELHELAAGMYTVILRSDSQQITKKIVINK